MSSDDELSSDGDEPCQTLTQAFALLLRDRTGIRMTNGQHRVAEMEAKLKQVTRVNALAGDVVREELDGDLTWSTEAAEFMSIVQSMGKWDPNVRCRSFVFGFFRKLVLCKKHISSLDVGVAAFGSLVSLDVSRNNLVEITHLPGRLQVLHAYENQVKSLQGPPLPSLLHLGLGTNQLRCTPLPVEPPVGAGNRELAPAAGKEAAPPLAALARFRNLISLDLSFNLICSSARVRDMLKDLRLRHLYLLGNAVVLQPYYRVLMAAACPTLKLVDDVALSEPELVATPSVTAAHWEQTQTLHFQVDLEVAKKLPKFLAVQLAYRGDLAAKVQEREKSRRLQRDLETLYEKTAKSVEAQSEAGSVEAVRERVEARLEEAVAHCQRGVIFEVCGPDGTWSSANPAGVEEEGELAATIALSWPVGDGVTIQAWLRKGLGVRFRYVPEPPEPAEGEEEQEAKPAEEPVDPATIFAGAHVQIAALLGPRDLDPCGASLPIAPQPSPRLTARIVPAALADDPRITAPLAASADELLADAGVDAYELFGHASVKLRVLLHAAPQEKAEAAEEEPRFDGTP